MLLVHFKLVVALNIFVIILIAVPMIMITLVRIDKLRNCGSSLKAKLFDEEVFDYSGSYRGMIPTVNCDQTKEENEFMEQESRLSFNRLASCVLGRLVLVVNLQKYFVFDEILILFLCDWRNDLLDKVMQCFNIKHIVY